MHRQWARQLRQQRRRRPLSSVFSLSPPTVDFKPRKVKKLEVTIQCWRAGDQRWSGGDQLRGSESILAVGGIEVVAITGFRVMGHRSIFRDEIAARLKELGNVSDCGDVLERTFLSPASIAARQLLASWMRDAGLRTWIDELGNVRGWSDGANTTAPALMLGSHLDTVIDAGKYDGPLGIVAAIGVVKVLKLEGKLQQFPRPIEIIVFNDEEGIWFHTTFLGSNAGAGTFQSKHLKTLTAMNEKLAKKNEQGLPCPRKLPASHKITRSSKRSRIALSRSSSRWKTRK